MLIHMKDYERQITIVSVPPIVLLFILLILLLPLGKFGHDYFQGLKVIQTKNDMKNLKIILEYHGITNLDQISIHDSWGTPILVIFDHNKIRLTSLGADKKVGGKGFARDIVLDIEPAI